jgi:predicted Zn finger-like uncharacterized protein
MYVACPSCKTLYPVTAEYLRLAAGQVRCSACETRFDASSSVFDDPQEALRYQYPIHQALKEEIEDLVDRALDGGAEAASADEDRQAADPAGKFGRADIDWYAWPANAEFGELPAFQSSVADRRRRGDMTTEYLLGDHGLGGARTAWGAIAVAVLLTAVLVAQYAYVERYQLVQVSALRPAIELLCAPFECNLPLRRDLARVEMVEREVREHPNVTDALLVHAAFVNRADFVQAFPVLQVSFSDVSGTPVAVRRFAPEEYLQEIALADKGMAPGQQSMVMLEVIDPGERAVSFQFDFM